MIAKKYADNVSFDIYLLNYRNSKHQFSFNFVAFLLSLLYRKQTYQRSINIGRPPTCIEILPASSECLKKVIVSFYYRFVSYSRVQVAKRCGMIV